MKDKPLKITEVFERCRHCIHFTPDKYEPFKHDGKCSLQPNVMCDPNNTCHRFAIPAIAKAPCNPLGDEDD